MIISIIENIVSQINLNGEVFSFGHGQEFFSNIQNDEETLPCIYLDQPINANYELTQSGHIGETYQGLRIYFMYKSELDYLPADHDTNCIIPANNVLRNFISLCQTSTDIKSISNATSLEFINLLNVNVSGILLTIDIEVNIDKSVCVNVVNPVCSPVAVTDTDLIVYSVPAGESFVCTPSVCSPATYTIKDTASNILYSGTIANGGDLQQTIQNSLIRINTVILASAKAEEDKSLQVLNSNVLPVGTSNAGNWLIYDSLVENSNATYSVPVIAEATLILPDVTHTDSDGSPTILPAQIPMVCSLSATDIFLKFHWDASNDITDTAIIDSDSAGVYTSITDDTASGTITVSVNGGAYVAFSTLNPLTLIATDTIAFTRTITTSAGWVKLTGTY